MDSETIVESLYELKSRGRHALDAVQLLRDELLHSPRTTADERRILTTILNEVETHCHESEEDLSLTLLFHRALRYDDVRSRWAILIADKITNTR